MPWERGYPGCRRKPDFCGFDRAGLGKKTSFSQPEKAALPGLTFVTPIF
jgi:hypothetical protein